MMVERTRTILSVYGAALLTFEVQCNCRPRRCDGEHDEVFYRRIATEYDMSVVDVMEVLG